MNSVLLCQVNLENGLVAFYPFNGNTDDESGNNQHAAIVNTPILGVDCKNSPKSAYYFDGINDYIEVPNNSNINFGISDSFAISVWIKAPFEQANSVGTVSDILSKWSANLTQPYSYTIRINNQNNNKPGAIVVARYDGNENSCNNSSKIESNILLNDNRWHNIIFQKGSDSI